MQGDKYLKQKLKNKETQVTFLILMNRRGKIPKTETWTRYGKSYLLPSKHVSHLMARKLYICYFKKKNDALRIY